MNEPSDKTAVLFVFVHNAGRSQMAAGYLTELAHGKIEVRSARSIPGDQVNPGAIRAMALEGMTSLPKPGRYLTTESVQASDVVITMGCGDACPIFPGKRYEDWDLEDHRALPVRSSKPTLPYTPIRVGAYVGRPLRLACGRARRGRTPSVPAVPVHAPVSVPPPSDTARPIPRGWQIACRTV